MAILTIARELGSGAGEIGEGVRRLLSYEYVDKGRLLEDIRKSGKRWEEWGKDFDEHCPTVWEKFDWSYRGFGALLQSAILEHAIRDNVVIMGRGGNFLLKGVPHALRVLIKAPLEQRVERVMRHDSVDRETAQWLMEKTDGERACLIHSIYGKKWDDPSEYDMLFDTGEKSIEEITTLLKKALLEKDREKTPEAKALLEMRALAGRVKAGVATDPSFFIPVLDVFAEGGEIIVRGVVHKPREMRRLEDRIRELAAPAPVRFELHFRK